MTDNYNMVPTTPEVAAVIRASHAHELRTFGSYSAPEHGIMETGFGIAGQDEPILFARTTWDVDDEQPHKRHNERHQWWLCNARETNYD